LSTTKTEFISLAKAVKGAIWLHGFLGDLGIEQVFHVVFCDNQSAIYHAKDKKFHKRTEHIDVIFLFDFMWRRICMLRKLAQKTTQLIC
jgi:hypothetical protein